MVLVARLTWLQVVKRDYFHTLAEANRISSMLNMVLGANRFPVKVDEVALEYSRQCFADSPVDKVHGEDLDG